MNELVELWMEKNAAFNVGEILGAASKKIKRVAKRGAKRVRRVKESLTGEDLARVRESEKRTKYGLYSADLKSGIFGGKRGERSDRTDRVEKFLGKMPKKIEKIRSRGKRTNKLYRKSVEVGALGATGLGLGAAAYGARSLYKHLKRPRIHLPTKLEKLKSFYGKNRKAVNMGAGGAGVGALGASFLGGRDRR